MATPTTFSAHAWIFPASDSHMVCSISLTPEWCDILCYCDMHIVIFLPHWNILHCLPLFPFNLNRCFANLNEVRSVNWMLILWYLHCPFHLCAFDFLKLSFAWRFEGVGLS